MWHGATGGVGGGLSRSDKKEGGVSAGGRGHTRWCPDLCCPPSVALLMLDVRDDEGRIPSDGLIKAGSKVGQNRSLGEILQP